MKLLIVEDDITSQVMLKTMLSEYDITIVDSGEHAIETIAEQSPDMVILDINLPGIDGYETCRRLRGQETMSDVPIIFLSSYSDLKDRLQAFGAGGNDYIAKPFDVTEMMAKIATYGKMAARQKKAGNELHGSHKMLMEVQNTASKIQSISRFSQTTLYCHDIDTLYRRFFSTAREIGLGCVLQISSESGSEIRSSSGEISILEREILEMSSTVDRIYSFGRNRAIFRWSHASLLARNVGEMIDTIAIFMDSLEAGIKAVDTEFRLLKQVEILEQQNIAVRDRAARLFRNMNVELKEAILTLGLISAFDEDEEDRLNDVIDNFGQRIDGELDALGENNKAVMQLINELRAPPLELQALMSNTSDDDGMVFF